MPLPAGVHSVVWVVAMPYAVRGVGNYASPAYATRYPRWLIADLELLLYVGAISGAPTLTWTVQSSADGGASWTNIPGTSSTISAAGNALANVGGVGAGQSLRFAGRITGGASDTMSFRALAVLFTADLP